MTLLDWSIVFGVILFAAWGFRQGAVIGVSSMLGFIGGTLVGVNLAGMLLERGNDSPYTPLFALAAALLVGAHHRRDHDGDRLSPARSVHESNRPTSRRHGRRGAAGRLRDRHRLGRRRGAHAVARRQESPTRRSAHLSSSNRSTPRCRRPAASSTRSHASTRFRRSTARRRTSPRRTRQSPATQTSSARPHPPSVSSARPAATASKAPAGSPRNGIVVTNAHVVAGADRHDRPAPGRRHPDQRAHVCASTLATTSRSSTRPA